MSVTITMIFYCNYGSGLARPCDLSLNNNGGEEEPSLGNVLATERNYICELPICFASYKLPGVVTAVLIMFMQQAEGFDIRGQSLEPESCTRSGFSG